MMWAFADHFSILGKVKKKADPDSRHFPMMTSLLT